MNDAEILDGRVLLECDGGVATISLCNPGRLNAINLAMWEQLADALARVSADPALRVLVVRGAGTEAFAAGGDLSEFGARRGTVDDAFDYHEGRVAPALAALAACPIPTVAMIHGACVGGGLEIAACCDIRIASSLATFGAPILRLGFSMYAGELAHVMRVVGPELASEILLEGRLVNAEEAQRRGLVGRIVAPERLEEETAAAVRRIAAGAPLVARAHKAWMRRIASGTPLTEAEKRASLSLVHSDDYREGLDAFFGKRRPVFTGR